ncbi:MAG: DUF2520 domain-containing protein [Marinilabiliaceae bacterium]|nr:DUF2520 domain-containing protein [Marinilabiliaceae bacterium]
MHVVLIGAGNVASHLAKMLRSRGIVIDAIWSRGKLSAKKVAGEVACSVFLDDISSIPTNSDFYIISVADSAIHDISVSMPEVKGIVLHTSGATPITALKQEKRGVLYPCQSFTKNVNFDYETINWLVEGATKKDVESVERLAWLLPHNTITRATSSQRLSLHLAAVWSSNFVNRMVAEAYEIMESADLDPHMLDELIRQTIEKCLYESPYEAQTGPARRHDEVTLERHVSLMSDEEQKELYRMISKRISGKY